MGITVCVASGDDATDDEVGDGRGHADFPSSSPHALAVGGTNARTINGSIVSEVSWKDGDVLRNNNSGS